MNILVAADGSTHATDALSLVLHGTWSRESDFKVVTVRTFGKLTMAEAESVNRTTVKALVSQFGEMRVFSEVRDGDAAHNILQAANDWSADLIVLGAHRFTGVGRVLLGSATDSVVSNAACSVLVVRAKSLNVHQNEETEVQQLKVLVCINLQRNSMVVLNYVAMHAWPRQAHFMLAHVFEPPTGDYSPSPVRDMQLFLEAEGTLREQLGHFIDKSVVFLQQHLKGNQVIGVVREDLDVSEALVSLSKEWQADLVVIGAPNHHGLFTESICKSVVLAAPCAVLVVRDKTIVGNIGV